MDIKIDTESMTAICVAVPDDIFIKLEILKCGSCSCLTKTNDDKFHDQKCGYRLLCEIETQLKISQSPRITEQDARETVILKAINEIEGSHFRTVHDHGASEHAQIVLGHLRSMIDLPMIFKSDLPVWDGSKYAMPVDSNLIANQPVLLNKINDKPESVGG